MADHVPRKLTCPCGGTDFTLACEIHVSSTVVAAQTSRVTAAHCVRCGRKTFPSIGGERNYRGAPDGVTLTELPHYAADIINGFPEKD